MSTASLDLDPHAIRASAENRMVFIDLTDGHQIGLPSARVHFLAQDADATMIKVEPCLHRPALRSEELNKDISFRGVAKGRFQPPLPQALAAR